MILDDYRRREQERKALHRVEDKIKIATLFFTAKQLGFLARKFDVQQTLAQGNELREDQLSSIMPDDGRITSIVRLEAFLGNIDSDTQHDTSPPQGIPEDVLYELSDLPDDNLGHSVTDIICGSQNPKIRMNLPASAVSGLISELDSLFDNQEFCANCEGWSYWSQPPMNFILNNSFFFLNLSHGFREDFREDVLGKFDGVMTDIFGSDSETLLSMDPISDASIAEE